MDGVTLTPLNKVLHPKGNIYHAMKKSDVGFCGFGEAYFSNIFVNCIKGWKKHSEMTLNLIVPVGEIKFVIYDEKSKSFFSVNLSEKNYQRLTVKPNLWLAFQGISESSMLLNIANMEHDPNESETIELTSISYEW